MARRVRGQIALDHELEVAFLFGTESCALQMIVDDDDRSPMYLYAKGSAHVALGREWYALLAMDGELAEHRHDIAAVHDGITKG